MLQSCNAITSADIVSVFRRENYCTKLNLKVSFWRFQFLYQFYQVTLKTKQKNLRWKMSFIMIN